MNRFTIRPNEDTRTYRAKAQASRRELSDGELLETRNVTDSFEALPTHSPQQSSSKASQISNELLRSLERLRYKTNKRERPRKFRASSVELLNNTTLPDERLAEEEMK